jgi:uncharacterized protein (DUF433 family)
MYRFERLSIALTIKCKEEAKMTNRIEVDPKICHGKPVIRGTRIPVRTILGSLAGGDTIADILRNFPELSREDIEAAVAYAIELIDDTRLGYGASA